MLSGLIRRRAEVGELEEAQSRVRRLMADIDAVDATIRMFSALVDLAEIVPKPPPRRHTAYHGEVMRAIYAAFRDTAGMLITHDVTMRVMASRQHEGGLVLHPKVTREGERALALELIAEDRDRREVGLQRQLVLREQRAPVREKSLRWKSSLPSA